VPLPVRHTDYTPQHHYQHASPRTPRIKNTHAVHNRAIRLIRRTVVAVQPRVAPRRVALERGYLVIDSNGPQVGRSGVTDLLEELSLAAAAVAEEQAGGARVGPEGRDLVVPVAAHVDAGVEGLYGVPAVAAPVDVVAEVDLEGLGLVS
jgi:hypothetical protein